MRVLRQNPPVDKLVRPSKISTTFGRANRIFTSYNVISKRAFTLTINRLLMND